MADAGSIRVARQAGPAMAIAAVTARTTVTIANVRKSSGFTAKSIVVMKRPSTAESARPITAPATSTRAASPTTSRSTSPLVAPRARRTPKSRIRC
jgi:hypothetical protein